MGAYSTRQAIDALALNQQAIHIPSAALIFIVVDQLHAETLQL